jgi:hypothetical protein
MNSKYIRGASLSCSALQAEIEQMLTGCGACHFRVVSERGKAAVAFSSGEHQFRLVLPNPAATDLPRAGVHDPLQPDSRGQGSKTALDATRHSWRELSSLIRAKLEAVSAGIVTFDEEFLAYMLMPGGGTVFQAASPAIASSYAAAGRPRLRDGKVSPSATTSTGTPPHSPLGETGDNWR